MDLKDSIQKLVQVQTEILHEMQNQTTILGMLALKQQGFSLEPDEKEKKQEDVSPTARVPSVYSSFLDGNNS